jgi:hypothetical protein
MSRKAGPLTRPSRGTPPRSLANAAAEADAHGRRADTQVQPEGLPIIIGSGLGILAILVVVGLLTGLAPFLIPLGVLLGLLVA